MLHACQFKKLLIQESAHYNFRIYQTQDGIALALRTMREIIPILMQFLEEIVQKDHPEAAARGATLFLKKKKKVLNFLFVLRSPLRFFHDTAYASDALQDWFPTCGPRTGTGLLLMIGRSTHLLQ